MFRQELALDAIEKQRRQRGEDSETMHDTEADSAQRVGDKIERRISELEKVKSQLLGLKLGLSGCAAWALKGSTGGKGPCTPNQVPNLNKATILIPTLRERK